MKAVRELVHIRGGQCGDHIDAKFWEIISDEHGVDTVSTYYGDSNLQFERISVHYDEATVAATCSARFPWTSSREPWTASVRDRLDGYSSQTTLCSNRLARATIERKGHYSEGAELIDSVLDVVRMEADGAIASKISSCASLSVTDPAPVWERFWSRRSAGRTPIASRRLEPCRVCLHQWGGEMHLIPRPVELRSEEEHAVNLIPFSRLHFFVTGFAPLTSRGSQQYHALTVLESRS